MFSPKVISVPIISWEQSFPVLEGLQLHTPWSQTPLFEQEFGQKAG